MSVSDLKPLGQKRLALCYKEFATRAFYFRSSGMCDLQYANTVNPMMRAFEYELLHHGQTFADAVTAYRKEAGL